ncbi:MAG: alpha/beta hydrolase [Gammaproteobacteria bacterium]|nr:alpha/beta hydrolase [Gammaproteobacteria bacterium]MDH4255541.1 alpha/beta hydrolase [Gammaproteobacteria bacterium]MDH5273164.1 alpha/beta hydrolase [Gammaproteobacteria bacterium]
MPESTRDKKPEDRIEIRQAFPIPAVHADSIYGDLYLPTSENHNGAAVILLFGGSWRTGDRSQQKAYGIALAKAGFTALACDYRLSSVAFWPAQNQDISTAAHWLQSRTAEMGLDPGRIGISGNSSGGHLALMAAAKDNDWRPAAVCAFYSPTRLLSPTEPGHDESFLQLMGPNASNADYQHASPLLRVHENYPPTLLIVGDADSRVSPENSFAFYQALKRVGATAELHSFAGLDHAFDMQRDMAMLCAQLMTAFFRRYL